MNSERKILAQEPLSSSSFKGAPHAGFPALRMRTGRIAMAGLLALTPAAAPIVAFAETPEAPSSSTTDESGTLTVADLVYVDPCKEQLNIAQAEFERVSTWFEPIDAEYRQQTAVKDAAVKGHADAASAVSNAEAQARGYISSIVFGSQEDVRKAEAALTSAQGKLEEAKSALAQAERTRQEADTKAKDALIALNAAQAAAPGVSESSIQAAKQAVDDARAAYGQATAEAATAEAAQKRAQTEYDRAVAVKDAAAQDLAQAETALANTQAQKASAQTALDSAKEELARQEEAAAGILAGAQQKVDEAKAALATANSSYSSALAAQDAAKAEYDTATTEVGAAEGALADAQANLAAKRQAVTDAENQLAADEAALTTANRKLSDLLSDIALAGDEVRFCENDLEIAQKTGTADDIAKAEAALAAAEAHQNDLLAQQRTVNTQISNLESAIATAPEKIQAAKDAITPAEAAIAPCEQALAAKQEVQEQKLDILNQKKGSTAAALLNVDTAQATLKQTEDDLKNAAPADLAAAQKAVEDAQGVLDSWTQKESAASETKSQAETALTGATGAVSSAQGALNAATGAVATAQQNVESSQEALDAAQQEHQRQTNAYKNILTAQTAYDTAAGQLALADDALATANQKVTSATSVVSAAETSKAAAQADADAIAALNLDYDSIYIELKGQQTAARSRMQSRSVDTNAIKGHAKVLVSAVMDAERIRDEAKIKMDEALELYGEQSVAYNRQKAVYDRALENLTLAQAFYDAAVARQEAEEQAALKRNQQSVGAPLAQTGDDALRNAALIGTLAAATMVTAGFSSRRKRNHQ